MADYSSAQISAAAAATSKATLGAEVVTRTLDKLNSGGGKKSSSQSGMSDTYNFSKDVLSSVYGSKGAVADLEG